MYSGNITIENDFFTDINQIIEYIKKPYKINDLQTILENTKKNGYDLQQIKKTFIIDVGKISANEVEDYIRKIKNSYKYDELDHPNIKIK